MSAPQTKTTLLSNLGDVTIPIGPAGLDPSALVNVTSPISTSGNVTAGGGFVLGSGNLAVAATGNNTAQAATLNQPAGQVTTGNLTTTAGNATVLTVTDSLISATDIVTASVQNGTNTGGTPAVTTVAPGSGTLAITVQNVAASAALNGTIVVSFAQTKAG